MALKFKNKKLIIFDLDGTLIDTIPIVIKILNTLRKEKGLSGLSYEAIIPSISVGGISMISSTLEIPTDECNEWLKKFRKSYSLIKTPGSLIYENVLDALKYLNTNMYLTAICSNKPINLINNALEDTNLMNCFNFIIGEDSRTLPKPSPERLIKCMTFFEKSNLETIFIGDSRVDQIAAQRAKVDFIFFEKEYDDGVDRALLNYSMNNFKEIKSIF